MISLASPIRTPFHQLPAGLKLALLCLFTAAVFAVESLWLGGVALSAATACYGAAGRRFLVQGVRMLRPLLPFLLVILLWHLVTDSVREGALIALKLLAAVGFANLVTMTTRLDDLIEVVGRLLAPLRRFGLQTDNVGIAIAMVVRFTPVLAQKGALLVEAWRGRSPRRPGWRIIAPLALLAIDDAEQVAEALRARGGVRG